MPGPRDLRSGAAWADAEELSLVLAAAGVRHRLEGGAGAWRLVVNENEVDAAEATLAAYEAEQARAPQATAPPEYGATWVGVIVGVLLVAFYAVTGPSDPAVFWFRTGSAAAERILAGEVWRTVTALTLHADGTHVVANAVASAVFVTAVGRALGFGLGGALILAAGAAGNALNALLHGAHHSSVGASTAVFGAVGILGGLGLGRRWRRRGWVQLGGAVALLALLGTGERADLLAHLFGFVAGGALGVGAALAVPAPPGRRTQVVLALCALGIVAGCWLVALALP